MILRTNQFYILTLIVISFVISACGGDESKKIKTADSEPISKTTSKAPSLDKAVKVKVYEALPEEDKEVESIEPKKEVKKKAEPKSKPRPTQTAKKKKKKPASAPKKPTPRKYAQASFESKTYDFDTITSGDVIDHSFVFKNTGSLPLEILEADASCGCTTPVVPFLDILPGEKNKISLSFNSVNKEGPQNPTVVVTTNGSPEKITLRLKGYVKPKEKKK